MLFGETELAQAIEADSEVGLDPIELRIQGGCFGERRHRGKVIAAAGRRHADVVEQFGFVWKLRVEIVEDPGCVMPVAGFQSFEGLVQSLGGRLGIRF